MILDWINVHFSSVALNSIFSFQPVESFVFKQSVLSDFAIKASFTVRSFVPTVLPFNKISIEIDVIRISFSTDRSVCSEMWKVLCVLFLFSVSNWQLKLSKISLA